MHVDVGPRAWSYVRARGRPLTHVAAVARNNANYADTAWYCAILRAVAAKFTQHHAQIDLGSICALGTCVHVRGCNQCECRHRNQCVRLPRARACARSVRGFRHSSAYFHYGCALRGVAREIETLPACLGLYLSPRNATRSRSGNKPLVTNWYVISDSSN